MRIASFNKYLKLLDALRPPRPKCINGCNDVVYHKGLGLCGRCYQRLRRYGSAQAKPKSRSAWA